MAASTPSGTQSIERMLRLLKLIAAPRGERGWRLSDLAEHCGLEKSTAHRLLGFLARERLVVRREADRHYFPGPLVFELCVTLRPFFAFVAAAQPVVDRLAFRTGGMAHLLLRSDTEFVCAVRGGDSIIKAPSIEIGTRRPLLAAAGGLAILAALDEQEARKIIARNVREASRYGRQRLEALRNLMPAARRQGYCFIEGQFVAGIHAIGVAVVDSQARPIASLSTVAPAHILPPSRARQVASWLRAEASDLQHVADQLALPPAGV